MEEVLIKEPIRPLDLEHSLAAQAKTELGETDEIREDSVVILQEWLKTQKELSSYKIDSKSLAWFLRGCKYDMKRTKSRILHFYKFRSQVPEWYCDRDPQLAELMDILSLGTLLPLRGRDAEGRRVMVIRASIHNPYKHKQDDVMKVMNMIVELLCREDEAISLTGVVAIVDLAGVGFGHAMQMTPSIIRKAVSSWQDVNPIRTKAMHYINAPFNVHVVLNIFRSFMKEKLRKRLYSHRGDCKKVLTNLIPCDILPGEYGGNGPSLAELTNEWRDRVMENRQWFLNANDHGPFSE